MNTPPLKPTEQINFAGAGLTILVLVVLFFLIDIDSVREWVGRAGVWAPLVFILLKMSTIVIAPLSGSPLYPLVGLLFGFWPGILLVGIGDFLGYTVSFFISRLFGKEWMARFLSDKEEGLLARVMEHAGTRKGFWHASLTLFAMPELLSYGAGLTKINYFHFITTIVPITLTGSALFVFIGSLLGPGSNSLWVGFGLPALGAIAMLIGGTLFSKSLVKNNQRGV